MAGALAVGGMLLWFLVSPVLGALLFLGAIMGLGLTAEGLIWRAADRQYRIGMARVGTLVVAVLVALAAAGCGGGSNPSAELSSFVVGYIDQNRDNCCEAGMHATVSHVTFARSDQGWAAVSIAVTDFKGRPDGSRVLVLHKIASGWQVVGFGQSALGCGVPVRLRTELAVGMPAGVLQCSAAA